MQDLTDYVQENSRARFRKQYLTHQLEQNMRVGSSIFLDQEIKSEDESQDDAYGMIQNNNNQQLLKRINVNKTVNNQHTQTQQLKNDDSLLLNIDLTAIEDT